MQIGVAGTDTVGNRKTLGEMPVTGCEINAIRTDGLGGFQLDVDLASRAGHFHQVVIRQTQALGSCGIHPQARFIRILVQQLVVLGAKLGGLGHLAGQAGRTDSRRAREVPPTAAQQRNHP